MVNMIWMDTETGVCVVTHELFSSPVQLLGLVLPLVAEKSTYTSMELKAVVARYEAKLCYVLQKHGGMPTILTLSEVEKLCPISHII